VVQVKSALKAGQSAMNDLRLAVFQHIQKLSLNYFDQTHQGRIISRADSDIDSLDRLLTWGASQLLASMVTLLGVFLLMLQFDWLLCLAVSAVIPPLAWATRWFHVNAMQAYRRMRQQNAVVTSAIAEGVNGVRVVQAFAREETNLELYSEMTSELKDRAVHVAKIFILTCHWLDCCRAWRPW
jgi:ABC-type multidrug transport system fused ATPase/permease subunit